MTSIASVTSKEGVCGEKDMCEHFEHIVLDLSRFDMTHAESLAVPVREEAAN
jgi:hypothetical protein